MPLAHRLPSLTTIKVPDGVDAGAVCKFMREQFHIEIGGGLGALKGLVWRVGLMGFNARRENALLCISALKAALDS